MSTATAEQQPPAPRTMRVRPDHVIELEGFQRGVAVQMRHAIIDVTLDGEELELQLYGPPEMRIQTIIDCIVNPPMVMSKTAVPTIITATPINDSSIILRATAPVRKRKLTLHVFGT